MKWIIYVLLFLLISCGKAFKTTVNGRVLNPVTGKGIPNIRVSLSKTTIGLPAGSEAVASVDTDENGNFEVSDRNFKSLQVGVSIDTYKYYRLGWFENGTYTSYLGGDKGNVVERDYHAVEYGYLEIYVKNQNCTGPNDKVEVFLDETQYGGNEIAEGFMFQQMGCVDLYGEYYFKMTEGKKKFRWVATKNGVKQTYTQEINIQANVYDTLFVFY